MWIFIIEYVNKNIIFFCVMNNSLYKIYGIFKNRYMVGLNFM